MMDELLEYDGNIPNIADYLMSVGVVKKQIVFPISRPLVDSDFIINITMTGIKDCDLSKMPDAENVVNGEANVCVKHYNKHKARIIHEMWMQIAHAIYIKKENEHVTTIGHTGINKPH